VSTSEGKCVLVEVGALISWCIYSYRIVMLLVPYMWASMTFFSIIDTGRISSIIHYLKFIPLVLYDSDLR